MDALVIKHHFEWWITYENKSLDEPGHHCATGYSQGEARAMLTLFRNEAKPGDVYECQRVSVNRTAEKLDW